MVYYLNYNSQLNGSSCKCSVMQLLLGKYKISVLYFMTYDQLNSLIIVTTQHTG